MNLKSLTFSCIVFGLLAMIGPLQADDREVIVTIENLAPENGVFLTPVWVGFHNGSFNLFDPGGLASNALERIAEDGDASVLSAEFAAVAGGIDEVILAPDGIPDAPVFDPGDSSMAQFILASETNRYMSFASMIIPSNDAFIGNSNPMAIEIFDAVGTFKGKQIITILGSMIWDAGTELNTEMDAAFLNQTDPNTGETTSCPVLPHPGFLGSAANAGSVPVILGATNGAGVFFDPVAADFTLPHTVVARITVALASDAGSTPSDGSAGPYISIMSAPPGGRGTGPIIYVTSQDLFYDSIVKASLPRKGPFQLLEQPDRLRLDSRPSSDRVTLATLVDAGGWTRTVTGKWTKEIVTSPAHCWVRDVRVPD